MCYCYYIISCIINSTCTCIPNKLLIKPSSRGVNYWMNIIPPTASDVMLEQKKKMTCKTNSIYNAVIVYKKRNEPVEMRNCYI